MSTLSVTLLALVASMMFLLYLRHTDPKRRRVFGLANWGTRRYAKQAWILCLSPGLILLLTQFYAAFIMWFAAFSLVGWLMALPKPKS